MNLVITFFAACVYLVSPLGQSNQQHTDLTAPGIIAHEVAWRQEYQDSRVKIESAVIVHTDNNRGIQHQRIVFRYTNLTSGNLKLSFSRKMMYNGVCYGCDKTDKKFSVELSAHQIKEFSAENKDKTFYIFSKDLKNTITKTLEGFELTTIETSVQ